MNSETGKWIILAGLLIVIVGVIIYFFHDKLHFIGRLPGDIRIEREGFRFYMPVTTMVIASIFISIVIKVIKLLGK
ncbi:DUF2905 domain-containing protein [Gynurincola endophyticus]|uniref:DUF2905 domain-containing protein n=1 Tax=Gynurincola endophyticus TaxID=2479004 RepID=UPI000F8C6935|nr:DUF2905 domain-containing protein [Gynurincola endophyticus]